MDGTSSCLQMMCVDGFYPPIDVKDMGRDAVCGEWIVFYPFQK